MVTPLKEHREPPPGLEIMNARVLALHGAIVHFEAIGAWYMAAYLRADSAHGARAMMWLFGPFFWNFDGLATDEVGWQDEDGTELFRLQRVCWRIFRKIKR